MKRLSHVDLTREQADAVIVGPDDATWALDRNGGNRNLSRSVTRRYAAAMVAGKWIDHHPDPLLFDECGNLMNGQHRLWAIVESGACVVMLVRTMQKADMVMAIDSGYKRTVQDQVRIYSGKSFSSTLIAAIRLWDPVGNSLIADTKRRMDRTPQECLELIESHPDEVAVASRLMAQKIVGVSVAAVGCALLVATKARGNRMLAFSDDLAQVVPQSRTVAMLRAWLLSPAVITMKTGAKYALAYERTVTAINYWLMDKELKRWPAKLDSTVEAIGDA